MKLRLPDIVSVYTEDTMFEGLFSGCVNYKDIKLYPDRLNDVGVMAYPLEYMSPKLPGLGDVDWGKYVSALTDIGFDGYTCIEVEDKAFESSREKVLDSLRLSYRYMRQFVI